MGLDTLASLTIPRKILNWLADEWLYLENHLEKLEPFPRFKIRHAPYKLYGPYDMDHMIWKKMISRMCTFVIGCRNDHC